MKLSILPLLFFGICLNVVAQIALKAGVGKLGVFNFNFANFFNFAGQMVINPFIILGFACYVVSAVVWLLVLSRVEVSVAYPMVSLGYVLNAFAAYYFFGENLSMLRVTGTLVILLGVFLVARS
jgi:multidrug transporter EmrE-like cation transporter